MNTNQFSSCNPLREYKVKFMLLEHFFSYNLPILTRIIFNKTLCQRGNNAATEATVAGYTATDEMHSLKFITVFFFNSR